VTDAPPDGAPSVVALPVWAVQRAVNRAEPGGPDAALVLTSDLIVVAPVASKG
jgi:hypothetical protein